MATYGANMQSMGQIQEWNAKTLSFWRLRTALADTVVITQRLYPFIPEMFSLIIMDDLPMDQEIYPMGAPLTLRILRPSMANLTIRSTARNGNLSALSGVTKITGNIRMDDNTAITNLSALSSLDTLRGRLIVRRNTGLTTWGN